VEAPPLPLLDLRVLVIDDDDDLRELLAIMLKEAGAEVRSAADPAGAMQTVSHWHPSVIVSDIAMPGMDGATLLRQIRSIVALRHVPAIAVSGFRPGDTQAEASGFDERITKPVAPEHLVEVVAKWGRRR
jgi:CheY-like chemotaxis protein